MRYENLGPVTNPDGSPTDLTRSMLAGTGRDPVAFAAGDEAPSFEEVVANPAAVSNGIRYQATLNGLALILTEVRALRAVVTRAQPTPIRRMTGDEAANAGFVPGVDFVTCDICEEVEFFTEGVPDWNGETGAHLSCEER